MWLKRDVPTIGTDAFQYNKLFQMTIGHPCLTLRDNLPTRYGNAVSGQLRHTRHDLDWPDVR